MNKRERKLFLLACWGQWSARVNSNALARIANFKAIFDESPIDAVRYVRHEIGGADEGDMLAAVDYIAAKREIADKLVNALMGTLFSPTSEPSVGQSTANSVAEDEYGPIPIINCCTCGNEHEEGNCPYGRSVGS